MIRALKNINKEIVLQLILAHLGIQGNERACRLHRVNTLPILKGKTIKQDNAEVKSSTKTKEWEDIDAMWNQYKN